MVNDFNRGIIEEFRTNGDKVGGPFAGAPMVLLTSTGAKSGRPHTTPLVYLSDGDRIVVFGSMGGAPRNPAWYHNLVAHPDATLEVGSEKYAAKARDVRGGTRSAIRAPGLVDPDVRRVPEEDHAHDTGRRAGTRVGNREQETSR